jgi:hypothetical protein
MHGNAMGSAKCRPIQTKDRPKAVSLDRLKRLDLSRVRRADRDESDYGDNAGELPTFWYSVLLPALMLIPQRNSFATIRYADG